jgi:hypothetical protein
VIRARLQGGHWRDQKTGQSPDIGPDLANDPRCRGRGTCRLSMSNMLMADTVRPRSRPDRENPVFARPEVCRPCPGVRCATGRGCVALRATKSGTQGLDLEDLGSRATKASIATKGANVEAILGVYCQSRRAWQYPPLGGLGYRNGPREGLRCNKLSQKRSYGEKRRKSS